MRRVWMLLIVLALSAGLLAVPGCSKQMVTVQTGEIVLCTYGEIVSDTTEDIEVPADEVADHGVTTTVVTCDFHQKLASLYEAAEKALAEGDLEAAERAFAEIAGSDPSYRDAATRLADLRGDGDGSAAAGSSAAGAAGGTASGSTPGSNGGSTPGSSGGSAPGTTPGTTPGGDDGPVGPIANLTTYIPDRLPGFVGQAVYSDPFVLFRDYLPERQGKIVQLAVEVEQFRDGAMATGNLDSRARVRYSSNPDDLKIGSHDAYFGTRPGYAGLAFTNGGIFVLLEVYTTSSTPAEHKDALVAAARAMTGQ